MFRRQPVHRLKHKSLSFDDHDNATEAAHAIEEEINSSLEFKSLRKYTITVSTIEEENAKIRVYERQEMNKKTIYVPVLKNVGKQTRHILEVEVDLADYLTMSRLFQKYTHESARYTTQASQSEAGTNLEFTIDEEEEEDESDAENNGEENYEDGIFSQNSDDEDDNEFINSQESENDYYLPQYDDDDEDSPVGPFGSNLGV